MGTIPSGYVQLPLWILIAIWALVVGFISYIWHSMSNRVTELERSEKEGLHARTNDPAWRKQDERLTSLEKEELNRLRQLSQDPPLYVEQHARICTTVSSIFKEALTEKMQHLEKRFDEMKDTTFQDIIEIKEGQSKIWDRLDILVQNSNKKAKDE